MVVLNYLFAMNKSDLQKMAEIKKSEEIQDNSSGRYIIKTDEKEKLYSNLDMIRDDITFIDELLCDYFESVNDVTKLPEGKVKKLFDRSEIAISKLDSLKNFIIQINEIFEREKLYNINGRDLVSFIGNKTDNPVLEIPNGIEKICSKAFNCVEGAVKIILPDSVKVIEDDAFYKCRTLIQVMVPERFKHLDEKQLDFCRMAKYYLKIEK